MTNIPKKKPYTKKKFLEQTELYMKGAAGGFDKVEMQNKIVEKGNILRRQGVPRKEVIGIIKSTTLFTRVSIKLFFFQLTSIDLIIFNTSFSKRFLSRL